MIILNFLLLTIKFLTLIFLNAILNNSPFLKIFFIIIFCCICYFLYHYPKPLTRYEEIIRYYKIHSKYELRECWFFVLFYISIFIIGIFSLRLYNIGHEINLKVIFFNIYDIVIKSSYIDNMLDISLVLVGLFTYIFILVKIIKYFKKFFIQLHIYYSDFDKTLEGRVYARIFMYDFHKISFVLRLRQYLADIVDKFYPIFIPISKRFAFKVKKFLYYIIPYLHHIFLLSVVFYDIFYNNYTLHYTYNILPIIFLFDLYVRISFIHASCVVTYDDILYEYMYLPCVRDYNEIFIEINGELMSIRMLKAIISLYLYGGLHRDAITIELEREINAQDNDDMRELKKRNHTP